MDRRVDGVSVVIERIIEMQLGHTTLWIAGTGMLVVAVMIATNPNAYASGAVVAVAGLSLCGFAAIDAICEAIQKKRN